MLSVFPTVNADVNFAMRLLCAALSTMIATMLTSELMALICFPVFFYVGVYHAKVIFLTSSAAFFGPWCALPRSAKICSSKEKPKQHGDYYALHRKVSEPTRSSSSGHRTGQGKALLYNQVLTLLPRNYHREASTTNSKLRTFKPPHILRDIPYECLPETVRRNACRNEQTKAIDSNTNAEDTSPMPSSSHSANNDETTNDMHLLSFTESLDFFAFIDAGIAPSQSVVPLAGVLSQVPTQNLTTTDKPKESFQAQLAGNLSDSESSEDVQGDCAGESSCSSESSFQSDEYTDSDGSDSNDGEDFSSYEVILARLLKSQSQSERCSTDNTVLTAVEADGDFGKDTTSDGRLG